MIVVIGKTGEFLEKRLHNFVKDKNFNIKIECQENALVDTNLFQKWLNEVGFVNQTYKLVYNTVLIIDQATIYYTDDLNEIFGKYNYKIFLIPKGCTSYNQPLEKCINNFKN